MNYALLLQKKQKVINLMINQYITKQELDSFKKQYHELLISDVKLIDTVINYLCNNSVVNKRNVYDLMDDIRKGWDQPVELTAQFKAYLEQNQKDDWNRNGKEIVNRLRDQHWVIDDPIRI